MSIFVCNACDKQWDGSQMASPNYRQGKSCPSCGSTNIRVNKSMKKTFKGEWKKRQDDVEKMGIEAAGAVPVSLLADQDLEDESLITDEALRDGVNITAKGTADNDKLEELKDKAEDADTEEQKDNITSKIKQTQEKRQKATIVARSVAKSFRDFWKKNFDKESEYDINRPGKEYAVNPGETDDEGEEDTKKSQGSENYEQRWVSLKRERKEATDDIEAMENKYQSGEKAQESLMANIESRKKGLGKTNAEIENVLNYLKDNG